MSDATLMSGFILLTLVLDVVLQLVATVVNVIEHGFKPSQPALQIVAMFLVLNVVSFAWFTYYLVTTTKPF